MGSQSKYPCPYPWSLVLFTSSVAALVSKGRFCKPGRRCGEHSKGTSYGARKAGSGGRFLVDRREWIVNGKESFLSTIYYPPSTKKASRSPNATPRKDALIRRCLEPALGLLLLLLCMPQQVSAQLDEVISQSVVRVFAIEGAWLTGTGSGFVINDQGYILTNYHVVENTDHLQILTYQVGISLVDQVNQQFGSLHQGFDESLWFGEVYRFIQPHLVDAVIVFEDPDRDFAILQATSLREAVPIRLGASDVVRESQEVYALGYPGSGDVAGVASMLKLKYDKGIIKSKELVNALNRPVYQITAEISPGNSGGPLVTECGVAIGLNTFLLEQGGQLTRYAVQVDPILDVLSQRGIAFQQETVACQVGAAMAGSQQNPWIWLVGGLALLLAMVAVVMAQTARGRRVVEQAWESVTTHRRSGAKHQPVPLPPRGRPVLRCLSGPLAGAELELDEAPLVIGRDPHVSQLVFPKEAKAVSGRHCLLTFDRDAQQFLLEDCWSTNGTFLMPRPDAASADRNLPGGQVTPLTAGTHFYVGNRAYAFVVDIT